MTEFFSAQLEREAPGTHRALERVPEGHNDWKPHPKSMPLGYLAALVATMPAWLAMMILQDEYDMKPPGGGTGSFHPLVAATNHELLQAFEQSLDKARAALAGTNDEHLLTKWRLKAGGHVVSEMARYEGITDAVFSHLAHHRGQLTVYLRLLEASVPAIYGPSADEGR
jgi:uncharacterized damage-inducible protein DinB